MKSLRSPFPQDPFSSWESLVQESKVDPWTHPRMRLGQNFEADPVLATRKLQTVQNGEELLQQRKHGVGRGGIAIAPGVRWRKPWWFRSLGFEWEHGHTNVIACNSTAAAGVANPHTVLTPITPQPKLGRS